MSHLPTSREGLASFKTHTLNRDDHSSIQNYLHSLTIPISAATLALVRWKAHEKLRKLFSCHLTASAHHLPGRQIQSTTEHACAMSRRICGETSKTMIRTTAMQRMAASHQITSVARTSARPETQAGGYAAGTVRRLAAPGVLCSASTCTLDILEAASICEYSGDGA